MMVPVPAVVRKGLILLMLPKSPETSHAGSMVRKLTRDAELRLLRCFTEKDLLEQLSKVLSDRRNKYALQLLIKHQLNNTIIAKSHTEH